MLTLKFLTLMRKPLKLLAIVMWLLILTPLGNPLSSFADSPSPLTILKECDEARGNLDGVIWTVNVDALERGRKNHREILVKSSGFDLVAETLSPARRKGQLLVQVNSNMWFYKPGLSKPVPVSQRQKLLGLAANGDIASTNYAVDYDIQAFEEVAMEGQDYYLFTLEAKTSRATYSRIKYWVSKSPHLGIKSEFYTPGGKKLIKSAQIDYQNKVLINDRERPFISRMVIYDELMSSDTTTLNFSDPALQPIPAGAFNLNLLRK